MVLALHDQAKLERKLMRYKKKELVDLITYLLLKNVDQFRER